jgi:hypothetical protein
MTDDRPTLPKWGSRTEVLADRIKSIEERSHPDGGLERRWTLDSGIVVTVPDAMVAAGAPHVGDYYVQYVDGAEIWMPAARFEARYTRLP